MSDHTLNFTVAEGGGGVPREYSMGLEAKTVPSGNYMYTDPMGVCKSGEARAQTKILAAASSYSKFSISLLVKYLIPSLSPMSLTLHRQSTPNGIPFTNSQPLIN